MSSLQLKYKKLKYELKYLELEVEETEDKFRECIGKFEKAFLPCISLVAEFGTNHIEKKILIISGLMFSEIVGGMKLKFGK